MKSDRITLKNCSFVKTVLMLLVILGHAAHFWTGDWFTVQTAVYPSLGLELLSDWVNSFHIYAFALVSGYIFAFKMIGGGTSNTVNSLLTR